ncbi:hypothetical protein [Geobacter sp. DSM 9736]|uniref:hypothetical protein n=1 Tax=Geobacter sp. DSM 9736 TaxID=1277350 RepID=UPI000B4FEB9F|nr:hypothetical protein [Geobacter sp. DSM 9736]SNB46703.1 hypothetical protein SAMN06269301_2173 [Geobacter sp. DSM 9736]
MELFSGLMVMMGILGFLLAMVWLVLPFVIIGMKIKLDRTHLIVEEIDRRLALLERNNDRLPPSGSVVDSSDHDTLH